MYASITGSNESPEHVCLLCDQWPVVSMTTVIVTMTTVPDWRRWHSLHHGQWSNVAAVLWWPFWICMLSIYPTLTLSSQQYELSMPIDLLSIVRSSTQISIYIHEPAEPTPNHPSLKLLLSSHNSLIRQQGGVWRAGRSAFKVVGRVGRCWGGLSESFA